jgi:hypothetical protein
LTVIVQTVFLSARTSCGHTLASKAASRTNFGIAGIDERASGAKKRASIARSPTGRGEAPG